MQGRPSGWSVFQNCQLDAEPLQSQAPHCKHWTSWPLQQHPPLLGSAVVRARKSRAVHVHRPHTADCSVRTAPLFVAKRGLEYGPLDVREARRSSLSNGRSCLGDQVQHILEQASLMRLGWVMVQSTLNPSAVIHDCLVAPQALVLSFSGRFRDKVSLRSTSSSAAKQSSLKEG